MFRTGYVWHPMGMPKGLPRNSRPPAEINPAAAAPFAAFLKNALLEIPRIPASFYLQPTCGIVS
jgi:hypothetical protein